MLSQITHPSEQSRLVSFYLGQSSDKQGRNINEIHHWDYNKLEDVHDYIQWLFPLKERSRFNSNAPILDEKQIEIFRTDVKLRNQLLKSLGVMLSFYGMECEMKGEDITISKSEDYDERKLVWLTYRNHNFLRITRILTSLRILGLERYARAYFESLDEIYQEERNIIGTVTYGFWKSAVMS